MRVNGGHCASPLNKNAPFDAETIADKGTFTDPAQYPEGIVHVIVNGEPAVRDGVPTHVRAGYVLRH